MGYVLYVCALAWAIMANSIGPEQLMGQLCFLIAGINFVGGAIVFALNDLKKP